VRTSQITAGVVVLALLGLLDALGPWLFPAPADAPPFVDALSLVLGIGTLLALAVWWARPGRALMWVAVVLRVLSALLGVAAIASGDLPPVITIITAVTILATIVGIVLVRGALGRSRTTAGV
jgi:hypothetical protein